MLSHHTNQLLSYLLSHHVINKLCQTQLKSLGYDTHMVGKWHLGYYKKEFQPLQRGFDTFYGFFSGAEYYFSHAARCEYPDWECQGPTSCWGLDFFDQDEPVYSSEGAYSTDLLTARAVEIIRQHGREEEAAEGKQDKPMFLYLPYQVPYLFLFFYQTFYLPIYANWIYPGYQ